MSSTAVQRHEARSTKHAAMTGDAAMTVFNWQAAPATSAISLHDKPEFSEAKTTWHNL